MFSPCQSVSFRLTDRAFGWSVSSAGRAGTALVELRDSDSTLWRQMCTAGEAIVTESELRYRALTVDPSKRLRLLYSSVLLLLAALVIGAGHLEQAALTRQRSDTHLVNIAGRQRMLSQRLVKCALALQLVEDADEVVEWRNELGKVLAQWSASHRALHDGSLELDLLEDESRQVQTKWKEIAPHFQATQRAACKLIDVAEDSATTANSLAMTESVRTILAHEQDYLVGMDTVVATYQRHAEGRVDARRYFTFATESLFLATLFIVFLCVFEPAAKTIQQQFKCLVTAAEAIDEKEELVQLNAQLVWEMERRQDSESRVRLLLDSTAEAIYGFDLSGNCTFCNAACANLLGFDDPAQLVGRNMDELFHHRRSGGTQCRIVRACQERTGTHVDDEVLWRADGTSFPAEYWSYPVFEGEQLIGGVVTFLDISERRRTEESLRESDERFRQLADNIDEIFWITSANGHEVIYVSPAYEKVFGRTCESLYAKPEDWLDGIHPADQHRVTHAFFEQGPKGEFDEEFRVVHRDGSVRWLLARGSAVRESDGEVERIVGGAWDMTDQKQRAELKAARDRAEAASAAKSQFLAMMSHELRTPLHGVLGMLDLLSRTSLDERQQGLAETSRSSARMLLALLNELLDFSRIEAGKLVLDHHEFELEHVVEDALRLMGPRAAEKCLELVPSMDIDVCRSVLGDSVRLQQVLVNLIDNALKFTHDGEVAVHVQLETMVDQFLWVRFQISDTGLGISADQVAKLFEPFYQADGSTTRKQGGMGLGLPISKNLVEAMGGRIGVETKEGSGSTFWFTTQLEWVSPSEPRRNVPPDLRSRRVFVAAKKGTLADALIKSLSSWDLATEVGFTAEETMRRLQAAAAAGQTFDLIITDDRLPDMSGLALVDLIRANQDFQSTSVLILTSRADAEHALRPFVRRLIKPVCPSQLLNAVSDCVCGVDDEAQTLLHEVADEPRVRVSPQVDAARILLAEDNSVNRMYVEELSRALGLTCDSVPNGALAVEAAQSGNYDVILMDWRMPEMDGFDATRLIRQLEQKGTMEGRVPIVALTANAVKGDRDRCLEVGMDDYLSKPFEADEFVEVFHRVLAENKRRSHDSEDNATLADNNRPAPIDTTALLSRCMGNMEFAKSLLEELEHTGRQRVESIAQHAAAEKAVATAEAAHSLKGAAGIIAAEPLRSLAAEIEAAARAGNVAGIASLIDTLRQEMARCLAFVPHIGEHATT